MHTLELFNSSCLFHEESDIRTTTLSYEATFFPTQQLDRAKHKLVWTWSREVSKEQLLSMLSDDLTTFLLPVKGPSSFPLKWAFNAVPSEKEWNRMMPESTFLIDARVSGLIPSDGRSAVIVPLHRGYKKAGA